MPSTYNIDHDSVFHQSRPRFVCKDWALHLILSEQVGYRVKCRDPRCSLSCYQHFRAKQAHILRRLFTHHLPSTMTCYRGHLRLHDNSSLVNHKHIVGKFFKRITQHAKRRHATIQVHATAHITGNSKMHYEVLVYPDLPKTILRDLFKITWTRVGGYKSSVPELDTEAEKLAAIKYAAKDTNEAKKEYRYLPSKDFNTTRYTANFFNGESVKTLWSELVSEWFPKEERPKCVPITDSKLYDPYCLQNSTPNSDLNSLEKSRKQDRKLRDVALSYLAQHMPRTALTACTLIDLSDRLSIIKSWLMTLLPQDPRIVRTKDLKYYRTPLESFVSGVRLCDPLTEANAVSDTTQHCREHELNRHHHEATDQPIEKP